MMDKILNTWDRCHEISRLWNSLTHRIRHNHGALMSSFCSVSGRSSQTFKMVAKFPYSPLNKTHSSSTGTVYCSPMKVPPPHHYSNEKIQSCTRNGNTITTVRTIIRRVETTESLRRCESSPTMVRIGSPLRRVYTSPGGNITGLSSVKIHPQSELDVEFAFPKLAAPPPPEPKLTIPTLSSSMISVRTLTPKEQNIFTDSEVSNANYQTVCFTIYCFTFGYVICFVFSELVSSIYISFSLIYFD